MTTKQAIHAERDTNAQADAATIASTALVVANGADELAVAAPLLHLDKQFTSAAYRGAVEPEPRALFWQSGNNDVFAADGKKRLVLEAGVNGWYINQPREDDGLFPADYELMDAMDSLCERGLATACQISHVENGKAELVPAWLLSIASLFVVCQGVPSQQEMQRDAAQRWGVAYAWGPDRRSGQMRSQLQFSCYVKEVWDAGYGGVFKVSLSGALTGPMLKCLKAQEYVLAFIERLRHEITGEDIALPYYAAALPTRASNASLTTGQGEKSRQVYFPVPLIPRLSQRDLVKARAYLEWTAISAEQAAILEDNDRVAAAAAWSIERSRRIVSGQADEEYSAGPIDDAPPLTDDDNPF
jgi:hypothetical protein